ncbi:ATP-binding protein [Novosphingobium sp.]|uniref:sensor histidine kinase n=1 Tax=Novosphingobium sp. TaxID=1874826 RepID=UPI0026257923|nr:ATP-binding protein [Novosphingobium sp.]
MPVTGRRPAPSLLLPAVLFGGLVAALAALLIAFTLTSRLADRQFDLARLSERQAAAVTRITTLIDAGAPPPALVTALDEAAALIRAEQRLTSADEQEAARVTAELTRLDQLRRLALQEREAVRRLATGIEQREAREVDQARARLAGLHSRATVLATLLAAVVLACAGAGAWLLAKRNRQLRDEVMARTRQVEAVDASRRLFFAKTSHELRTPVQAIRAQAEIALAAPGLPLAELRETLGHVLAGTVSLGHRIDELLGLASADNGQLQLRREAADLGQVIATARDECAALARSVECTLAFEAPDQPVPVRADARWLRQALIAVIENGLKFSPMGDQLRISLSLADDRATIIVTDHGPGVVESDLPRIFDAFYQAEAGRSRGGNGLGLALARWVVEQHGGAIRAANLVAGGCAVMIVLPVEAAA